MPWNPGNQFVGGQLLGQGIASGANILSQDLMKAMQRYEEDRKQRDYNTGLFESIKDDPNMSKYVPIDALARWHSKNPDQQAGILVGVARRATADVQQQQMERLSAAADAQQEEARARANLLWAQGQNEWTGNGQGQEQNLNLTPEEIAAGGGTGRVPLRTSRNSFQWVEDQTNPVNMGVGEPMPIDKFGRKVNVTDPNAEVIGLQGANGTIHLFPKPTNMETYIADRDRSARKGMTPTPTPSPTPSPTPTVTPTPAPMKKVRVKSPTGQIGTIPADRLKTYTTPEAIAAGWTVIE